MGEVVELKASKVDTVVSSDAGVAGTTPNNPPKMLEANGQYQYDENNKRIVAPNGAYLSAPQVVETLNVMGSHGQLLYDMHTAIEVVLFGRKVKTGGVVEDDTPSAG